MISPGVQSTTMGREESTPDLRSQRYAEVAALQNSLAHMSMPHSSELGMYGHSTPPPHRGQRSPLLSPSGVTSQQHISARDVDLVLTELLTGQVLLQPDSPVSSADSILC